MFFSVLDTAGRIAIGNDQHFVIIIDGVDELNDDDGAKSLDWVPTLCPPGVRVVVSCTPASECSINLRTLNAWVVILPPCFAADVYLHRVRPCSESRDMAPALYEVASYPHDSRRLLTRQVLMRYRKRLTDEQVRTS